MGEDKVVLTEKSIVAALSPFAGRKITSSIVDAMVMAVADAAPPPRIRFTGTEDEIRRGVFKMEVERYG